jgi:hypothetical protein
MAKKSGILIEIITKFGGIPKQSIRKLGGKLTAELGFGPDYNAGPTNIDSPNFGTELLVLNQYPTISRGTWTGTGNITYVYKWYSDGILIQTDGPYPREGGKGIEDFQPSFNIANSANYLFTTIRLEIDATDDVGTTTQSIELKLTESTLNTFLTNSGITNPTRVAAVEYLRKAILTSTTVLYDSDLRLDYYPFAGETEYQNKWSLSNPSEYLQFSGPWTHNGNGSQANYGIAQSTKLYNNTFGNKQFAYGMYTNTNNLEDFRDLRLDTFNGGWDFGASRRVNGLNKVYWTSVSSNSVTTDFTSNDSAGSMGLSGLYRETNSMSVISGGSLQSAVGFGGNTNAYSNAVFTIGGATKNYQFAFIANFISGPKVTELNTILQTYQSMLGR